MTTTPPRPISPNRRVRLWNKTCPYCGEHLAEGARDLEHVIGKKFVPTGTMNGAWNLHVWSCRPCNVRKSELEDDASAITQLGSVSGAGRNVDAELLREANRKALGAASRRTGKPVIDSRESITMRGKLGPADASISMSAPPQLDLDRANLLALFHLKAFFYWLTYDDETGVGHRWPGKMFPLNGTTRTDFGNVRQTAFAKHVSSWQHRLVATTAAMHYQVAIRKHPAQAVWSFALEWNRDFRLVGFFGDEAACEAECDTLPHLEPDFVHEEGPHRYSVRMNRSLDASEDILFEIGDG